MSALLSTHEIPIPQMFEMTHGQLVAELTNQEHHPVLDFTPEFLDAKPDNELRHILCAAQNSRHKLVCV